MELGIERAGVAPGRWSGSMVAVALVVDLVLAAGSAATSTRRHDIATRSWRSNRTAFTNSAAIAAMALARPSEL